MREKKDNRTFATNTRILVNVHALDNRWVLEAQFVTYCLYSVAVGVTSEDWVEEMQRVAHLQKQLCD